MLVVGCTIKSFTIWARIKISTRVIKIMVAKFEKKRKTISRMSLKMFGVEVMKFGQTVSVNISRKSLNFM